MGNRSALHDIYQVTTNHTSLVADSSPAATSNLVLMFNQCYAAASLRFCDSSSYFFQETLQFKFDIPAVLWEVSSNTKISLHDMNTQTGADMVRQAAM